MKMKKILLGASVVALGATLASCGGGENPSETGKGENGKYTATIWVSEVKGVTELTQRQVNAFNEANPDAQFDVQIEGISEADAASKVLTDVASAPDIYCFAQDQMNRLVNAEALSQLGVRATEIVQNDNSSQAVSAASVNGKLYAYPITADNGYFMIYNKSIISQENINNLEAIVKECEDSGYNFSMENETSAWYIASWFFGAGCLSEWTTNADGNFVSVHDTFNSNEGMIAMEGMTHLVKSTNYVSSSNASDFGAAKPSAVVVTGTWGVKTAQEILGENFAAAKLPSYHVGDKAYQMGSYSGFKLLGVKPNSDAKKQAALHRLAQYLSNEQSQLDRFELVGWGPSNKSAANNSKVTADIGLKALSEQLPYSTVQSQIHGSWWDIAKVLGQVAKDSTSNDDLQTGLDTYKAAIEGLFKMTPEQQRAFTVIGSLNGTGWATDFEMVESPENVWTSKDTFTITQADIDGDADGNKKNEFKCRQGLSWDVSYGKDGGSDNFVITTPGTYKIKLTVTSTGATIELINA